MTFLVPAAAALAITLPAIVALYFLRIRRPTRVVPALHLWPDQIRDRQANVPWQRLRMSWLLLLQLLVAAFLVAAALQPALPASANLAQHSIVLLDSSASMQAKDVSPSRFDEARHQVGVLIDELGPLDRMTLISLQSTPRIVVSSAGDRDAIRRALAGMAPTNGPADLSAALALAGGVVRPGENARAYLFGDGIVLPLRASFAAGLPFPIEYHKVGVSGENVALTSLVVRTSAQTRASAAAIDSAASTPRGVSIMHQSAISAGAPALARSSSACAAVADDSTFGSNTASAGDAASAPRSSAPHGVSMPFTRTTTSRVPYPPPRTAATAMARASSLASGATASSRSKMRTSAGSARAFSSARALDAGMNSALRRGRAAWNESDAGIVRRVSRLRHPESTGRRVAH